MISFGTQIALELRRRLDTRGSIVGFAVLAAFVAGCGVLSVSLIRTQGSFGAADVFVTVGLPAALASSMIGVVVGVGDGRAGGERDGVLTGLARGSVYLARACAGLALIAGLVTYSAIVATACTAVAISMGAHVTSFAVGGQLGQIAALSFSAAAMGFGIGAAMRSLALALVGVVLIVLVLDTALSLVGPWSEYVRFSALQGGLLGQSAWLPALTSGLLWVGLPCLAGWLRTRTVEV